MTDQNKEPGIALVQVYLDSVEFSHRADALSLPADTKAEVGNLDVALEVAVSADEKGGYIKLTLTTSPDAQPIYKVRLTMIALAMASPEPNMPLREFLIGFGVPTMYPFVREALANITQRGRFGPVWLNPINTKKVVEDLQEKGWKSGALPAEPTPGPPPEPRRSRQPLASASAQARALRRKK